MAPVERPVNLKAGSSISVHFSVPYRGDRDMEIWYPRKASDDVCKDLDGILGKATLTLRGKEDVPGIFGEGPSRRPPETRVAQFPLPVDHHRGDADGCAMVLSTGPMEPQNDYSLLLQVDSIPQSLADSQATVKVELVSDYYLLFLELELVGILLLLAALFCAFLSVRWSRAAARARGNLKDDAVMVE
jgi:hypothetical protein